MIVLLFIVLLNVVAIALTYYCLENTEKKEKVIFIAVGIAIMYIFTSIAYWLSTKNIELKDVSELGKNLITFLFVPINGLIILPIFSKSYIKYKRGKLKREYLRNRIIALVLLLLGLLIIECMYFADIQNRVVEMVGNSRNSQNNKVVTLNKNEVDMNVVNDIIAENEKNNNILNNAENDLNIVENNNMESNSITNIREDD